MCSARKRSLVAAQRKVVLSALPTSGRPKCCGLDQWRLRGSCDAASAVTAKVGSGPVTSVPSTPQLQSPVISDAVKRALCRHQIVCSMLSFGLVLPCRVRPKVAAQTTLSMLRCSSPKQPFSHNRFFHHLRLQLPKEKRIMLLFAAQLIYSPNTKKNCGDE